MSIRPHRWLGDINSTWDVLFCCIVQAQNPANVAEGKKLSTLTAQLSPKTLLGTKLFCFSSNKKNLLGTESKTRNSSASRKTQHWIVILMAKESIEKMYIVNKCTLKLYFNLHVEVLKTGNNQLPLFTGIGICSLGERSKNMIIDKSKDPHKPGRETKQKSKIVSF